MNVITNTKTLFYRIYIVSSVKNYIQLFDGKNEIYRIHKEKNNPFFFDAGFGIFLQHGLTVKSATRQRVQLVFAKSEFE